jgi:hypothetical protein
MSLAPEGRDADQAAATTSPPAASDTFALARSVTINVDGAWP